MTVVYGSGMRMKFPTTRRLSTIRDLSIHDGKNGWGVRDVGVKSYYKVHSYSNTILQIMHHDVISLQMWIDFQRAGILIETTQISLSVKGDNIHQEGYTMGVIIVDYQI